MTKAGALRGWRVPLATWVVWAAIAGCGNGDDAADDSACAPGRQESCPCTNGGSGVQICRADGSGFDACQCGGSGTGGSGTGGAGAGGTATGGAPAGTGSVPGTGGQPSDPCASPVTDLIVDFETAVAGSPPLLLEAGGREGQWFTDGDAGTSITAAEDLVAAVTRCASTQGVHVSGTAAGWGAVAGFNFVASGNTVSPYDVSGKTGVAFFAKGTGTVRVELQTAARRAASDYYGTDIVLTSDWQLFVLPLAEMTPPSWSENTAPLDANAARGLQLKSEAGAVDYWLDDLGFY